MDQRKISIPGNRLSVLDAVGARYASGLHNRVLWSHTLLLLFILGFFTLNARAQSTLTSRDNYRGSWTDPASWDPLWPKPRTDSIDANIAVYGNITCNLSLSFSEALTVRSLNIYDTLVIYGDFLLRNKDSLLVHSNATLIVWGNLTAENSAVINIKSGGRIAIIGDYSKLGAVNIGSFTSENFPSNVFIGGEVQTGLNPSDYPVLVCTDTVSYDSSGCSYGNLADLNNEVFFDFFVSACNATSPTLTLSETSGLQANDGILCAGESAQLSSSFAEIYLWSTGETTPSINVSTSGDYSLTVTFTGGCQSAVSPTTIVVNPLPLAAITLSDNSGNTINDGILCAGDTASLLAAGGISYLWNTGETTEQILADTAGTYRLTVTDANGCSSSTSKNIGVNSLPVATLTLSDNSGSTPNDGILCAGDTATLIADGGISYVWNTTETTAQILADTAGTYWVTITDANGCSSSANKSLGVNPLPTAGIAVSDNSGTTTNDGILCAGDTATLTADGGISYVWNTTEKNRVIEVTIAGEYRVTVSDNNACSNNVQQTIEVKEVPTLNAGPDDELCGTVYKLQASISSGIGQWSSPSGNKLRYSPDVNSAQAKVYTDSYESYTLIWSSVESYCPASDELTLTFVEPPVAFAGEDQQLNGRFETTLEAELPLVGIGSWNLLSGFGILDNPQSAQTRVSQLGKGTNRFVWEVQNGICSASDTVALMVSDLFIPQVITPNGDGKNDFFIIDDLESHAPASLLIFNRWGNPVYSSSNYQNDWEGISDKGDKLAGDTYFYALQYANGKVLKGFIVIKR